MLLSVLSCTAVFAGAFANAGGAPFTPQEVARRMNAGTTLSEYCFLEARINRSVAGQQCRNLATWTEREFPLIRANLEHTTGAIAADFAAYRDNLAAIVAIANEADARTTAQ